MSQKDWSHILKRTPVHQANTPVHKKQKAASSSVQKSREEARREKELIKRMINKLTTNEDALQRCNTLFKILYELYLCVAKLYIPCTQCSEPLPDTILGDYRDVQGHSVDRTSIGEKSVQHMQLESNLYTLKRSLDEQNSNTKNFKSVIKESMAHLHAIVLPNIKKTFNHTFEARTCTCSCSIPCNKLSLCTYDLLRFDQKATVDTLTSIVSAFLDNNDDAKIYETNMRLLSSKLTTEDDASSRLIFLETYLTNMSNNTCTFNINCDACGFPIAESVGYNFIDGMHNEPECNGNGASLPQLIRLIKYVLSQDESAGCMDSYTTIMKKLSFYVMCQIGIAKKVEYFNTYCLCWKSDSESDLVRKSKFFCPAFSMDEHQIHDIEFLTTACTEFKNNNDTVLFQIDAHLSDIMNKVQTVKRAFSEKKENKKSTESSSSSSSSSSTDVRIQSRQFRIGEHGFNTDPLVQAWFRLGDRGFTTDPIVKSHTNGVLVSAEHDEDN